jgi:hypothetical protein
MNEALIKLFGRVEIVTTDRISPIVPASYVHTLNTTIAALGYTLDRDVIQALMASTEDDFGLFLSELVRALTNITGASHDYQVLFAGFPYDTPDQHKYLMRRVGALVRQHIGHTKPHALLPCGHLIDPAVFDIAEFGACPICQFQVPGLRSAENVLVEYQPLATPLKRLGVADTEFLTQQANTLMGQQRSMSLDERAFLISRLFQSDPPLTIPDNPFREILPLAWCSLAMRGGYLTQPKSMDKAQHLVRSATDVLRIATFLSNPMADLSLAEPTRYKLSTSRIKTVLHLLNGIKQPEEDMRLHAERWKKLSLVLKPGTAKHRQKYPNAATAFDMIMRHDKEIETFNRTAEKLLASRNIEEYARLLSSRPGEFMRKLDAMLRRLPINQGHWDDVLVPMVRAVPRVPTPLLLTVRKYLMHRGDQSTESRVFRPKGPTSRITVAEDTRPKVPREALLSAISLIHEELSRRFREKPDLGKVWIDPALHDIPLPHNRRGDSSTSAPITKGMRWSIAPDADVVRLFIWWQGSDHDVDLSINMMDRHFNDRGHVGFTNLSQDECYHSGDIQRAPQGAAEFIDVPIRHVAEEGVRYLCMTVLSWTGQTFDSFPCFAGFMQRDAVKSGQRFEPESVSLKLDVSAKATGVVPAIFDLVERQMIYADIATGSNRMSSALRHSEKYLTLTRAVIEAPRRMPTVGDVVELHARARGTIIEHRTMADTVWTAEDLDWNEVYSLLE